MVDPGQAQWALDDGAADLVEMTRAQITDPDLVARLRGGEADRIRPCLLCNQACMVRDNRNPVVTCVIEPSSGHELDDGDTGRPGPDRSPGSVLVVGGGPAGMEGARVLAVRGHHVRLAERGPALGGMLATAALVHGRQRLAVAVDWWRRELQRLDVAVSLGHAVTAAELDDALARGVRVVLATGSVPGPRGYRIAPGARVLEAADLIALVSSGALDRLPAGRAVVFDPIGGPVGVGVAELLAANGRPASIVTQDQIAGTQLALTGDLAEANSRLQRAGVVRELRSLLRAVASDHVLLEDRWTGEQRTVDCAFVVHCGHRLPEQALYLHRPGTPRAGDCVAPRTVLEAVLEARRAALAVGAAGDQPARRRPRADHDRRWPMSAASRYRYLFSPLRIGPVVVRNRIVFSAHLTNYAEDGLPSQQHADYFAARAAGGAGLIITEEHSTHPTDWPYEKLIHGFHRAVIPGYRRITEAVHAHDVPIFAQLNHNGGQASSMFSRLPVWAPSAVPDPMFREVPKAVERHEIAEIVAGYGTVAGHCAEGGFDGIELQCSHSSIVRGFLSPATNKRTDAYGGSLDNRARILREIVDAVREAIGPDRALGVRICGDELIEGGSTLDEAVERGQDDGGDRQGRLHQHLDRRGHRDAVHDRGVHEHPARVRPVHRQCHPAGGQRCRWSGWAVSRTRSRPSARWRRGTATWWAWCAARSPTPTSPPRPAPGMPPRSAPACPATRSASAGWA